MDDGTKAALEAMEKRIMERFDRVDKRFDKTDERIFDVETKLVSAFRDWSTPILTRLRSLPLIDERLGLLEERISVMERKLLERGM